LGIASNIFDKWHLHERKPTILIEEEKEQEEINVTTPTDIKKERFVNASKKQ
jgi:hypothetical protein